MERPDFVQAHLTAAQSLVKRHAVKEPNFSRGTYQVEVVEKKKAFIPFLQIEDDGRLADAFCTCKESEGGHGCVHLAAAYLRIFQGTEEPLHVRFRNSLWNKLFQMACKRHGVDTECLSKKKKGSYFCASQTKKKLFTIEASGEKAIKRLEKIIAERVVETEETSIKFSNLPVEEIAAWRAGKGSHQLLYELSFWADLAKWLMWLDDEGEKYEIETRGRKGEVPHEITLHFPDIGAWFYISDVSWPSIIPALKTVRSPLSVFENEEKAGRIHYDRERRLFVVEQQGERKPAESDFQGISVGDWLYVEGKGFYRKRSEFQLLNRDVPETEIGPLLESSAKELQKWLDVPIHIEPTKARYQLHMDEEKRLHVHLYAFEPHDLDAPAAACFFPWIYLPKKGFWRLQELMFEEKEKIVESSQVSDFVNRHRHFLHQFPGFQTHFGSLEAHLTYSFDEAGNLVFNAQLDFPEQFEDAIDFDQWVYLKGQGFYMKRPTRGRLPLHPGMVIPRAEIGSFLASHKEDLEPLQGFFTEQPPVTRMGLSIQVNEEGRISIEPMKEMAPEMDPAKVHFYGDFAYVEGKGFSELPPSSRLPERYRTPTVIPLYQESAFLAYEFEPLKASALSIDPRLMKPVDLHLKIRKVLRDRRKRSAEWLLDAVYSSEQGQVDILTLWDGFQDRKSHLFTPAGLLSLKEARFNWVRQLGKRRLDRKRNFIRLNTLEWIRLSVFEEIKEPQGDDPEAKETRAFIEELNRFESHRLLDISRLKSTLRPYQELGVQWLWFLYCHGLSGLLCDDMGLGKTHQAMALLAAVMHEDLEKNNKYLVVCPTSVIYHWQDLLQKFLPDLRVLTYYGIARSLEHFEADFDLLLTSYGILRTGREDLRSLTFEVSIYDEIQIAKNYASQTHQALRSISGRLRLGLTGTPIENRLRELKSLFDIALPGYLPGDAVFRELFITPIEKHQDPEQKALLSKLIKPFILRRKKSEVLTDLPEKIEEIAYCDLSEEQRQLYREFALQMRDTVYQDLKNETKPIPYMHVFSALSALKQICDHPSLHYGDIKQYTQHSSGKWDLFVELINEARDSGQKVVVFSQYLNMLAIIEAHLKKKGIGYASIKGSTRDRSEQLRRFREDPACEIFVASLLAAGVGIDLTVASIVIHYDRWWNPAKENQATDRVHRIGQNRGVQVFKLVTKHTIEEQIHALIEKKKGLLEELIGAEESDQITYLTRDELIAVFETMTKAE